MITVIDSPCGYGKTSYAINMINDNPTKNFVYITPFLDEVGRVIDSTRYADGTSRLKQPTKEKTKMESLNRLLDNADDIASTHALFKGCTSEIINKCRQYTLILDEVMSVVEQVSDLTKDDVATILNKKFAHIDKETSLLIWDAENYNGRFNDIKAMCKQKHIFIVNGIALIWTFPVEIFEAFQDIYICTYMFDAQIQKYYYDMYGIEYVKKSVNNGELIPWVAQKGKTELINILEGSKINSIGDTKTALSKNWYLKNTDMHQTIKKGMINYIKHIVPKTTNKPVRSCDVLWTTYKDFQSNLAGKGYSKSFAPLNCRATNQYINRYVVMYMANIFINPIIEHFFKEHNVNIDQDKYALAELIQFIYRTRIREDKEIYCYIPSKRLRELLIDYCK